MDRCSKCGQAASLLTVDAGGSIVCESCARGETAPEETDQPSCSRCEQPLDGGTVWEIEGGEIDWVTCPHCGAYTALAKED